MKASPTAIRLSVTDEISRALAMAKKRYPTLTDAEILKLGLSKVVTEPDRLSEEDKERYEIRANAARGVGSDYLNDSREDIYSLK